MKALIILCVLLSGCATFPSKHIHPKLGYRENPKIKIVRHSLPGLFWECNKKSPLRLATLALTTGCATVPYDPNGTCVVHVHKGENPTALEHELKHCHGYRDSWLPGM